MDIYIINMVLFFIVLQDMAYSCFFDFISVCQLFICNETDISLVPEQLCAGKSAVEQGRFHFFGRVYGHAFYAACPCGIFRVIHFAANHELSFWFEYTGNFLESQFKFSPEIDSFEGCNEVEFGIRKWQVVGASFADETSPSQLFPVFFS